MLFIKQHLLFDLHTNSRFFFYVVQFGMLNAAQLITCRPGCVSVKGRSSRVKGQGASVSTDEISRIMDMPAVAALLRPSDYRTGARVTPGKADGEREEGWVQTE